MLGVGIWLAVDDSAGDFLGIIPEVDDGLYWGAVYLMIAVGAMVFLVGFLGCVGALRAGKGNNLFLRLYFIIVKLIIITEIVCVILIAVFWTSINDGIQESMYKDVTKEYYNETAGNPYSKSWNKMQVQWKCCGSYNYTDYASSLFKTTTGRDVPWTCCIMEDGTNGESETDVKNRADCNSEARRSYDQAYNYVGLNPGGCFDAFQKYVDDNAAIIIGITCGFIGLQLLGSIMSCILMKKGRD